MNPPPPPHVADKLGNRAKRKQNWGQGNRKRLPLPPAMSLQHPLLAKLHMVFVHCIGKCLSSIITEQVRAAWS